MTRAIVALVALALALPAAAVAQDSPTNAPPGNSAIDEYLETVPGASGNKRPREPGQGGGGSALTPAQRAQLESRGPEGKTLADAVDGTSSEASGNDKGTTNESATLKSEGRSPTGKVLGTVSGSDGGAGMGVILPAILIAALLAAIAFVALRRRRASS